MKELKQKILNNLKNTYCRIKKSRLQGIGVVAIRDIPKGANPFKGIKKQRWTKFHIDELANLDSVVLEMADSFFVIKKNGFVWIPECGLSGMDISFFLNDSKKPNLKTTDDGNNFVTLKKIKKGEELTVAYSTYDEKYK
jgi:SET domain-containing protein